MSMILDLPLFNAIKSKNYVFKAQSAIVSFETRKQFDNILF